MTETLELRAEVQKRKNDRLNNLLHEVENTLMPEQNRAAKQAKQKDASSWLISLEDHGFTLTKGEFRDALALRYNKPLYSLLSNCPCGQKFNVTHALNCKKGGFVTMRHNNIRDFEANLLRIVHNDVEFESQLQQVDNEQLNRLKEDNAHPDIRAKGVWRNAQNAYFDVRVTNINSDSQKNMPVEKILSKHKQDMKRNYITGG